MRYEWDEAKNRKNIEKHGISFERAITLFAGDIVSAPDTRYNYGELRTKTIGRMEDAVIVLVVHTKRSGSTRIISARPANRLERNHYETQTGKK